MKPAVLVVDDDPAVCDLLQDALSEHALRVYRCHQGKEALAMVSAHPDIALVMLDMMLPDTNGLLVLQQLQRQRPDILVIMLTGMGSESEMVVGLEMGADDYIAKPFNPRVVVARARAALRRSGRAATSDDAQSGWRFNGWVLDEARCQLLNPQRETVPLTQGEYTLLRAMVRHARKVLTRDQLLELTHSETMDVFDRTIDVLIMRLRRKIEANPHQPGLIRTIRGLGYVFSADVVKPEGLGLSTQTA
ncbi:DNA-binding response OmpR family regulator [Pantoea sp. PNA 14-12]|uniref:response regulator n=1 Tax=Pantoea TaxID=53335 RepID=UPI00050F3414|nr:MULTISPECIES: response regulator transcription factor [Pantoea]KGD83896.1 histidine kinase [Pantoea stewartii subsp. indologenes]KTS28494.1 histidine kinase [Pantoea stewartii]MBC0852986.1 response regulator transcription factor [Pantoea stewartii]NRH23996.1 DNA-binding response regulator [Pantoea stewartii]PXV75827.1 DNA-binding response OmpR family regulator [Pantoea sp. PNA 03-3]